MSVFSTSKHFCSWAGLTMKVPEKKKTTRSSRAGAYIKPLLVQCALCAIRAKQYPEVRNRYLALKKRCGNKKAIIAVALVLLTAIYNILKKNESYNPEPYRKADRPPYASLFSCPFFWIMIRLKYFKLPSFFTSDKII